MDKEREFVYERWKAGLSPAEISKESAEHFEKPIKADTIRKWIKRLWTNNDTKPKNITITGQNMTTGQDSRTGQQDRTVCQPKNHEKILLERAEENTELNDKQRKYCVYYVQCFKQIEAYQRAYECSYKNACRCASQLHEKTGIKNEIKRLKKIKLAELEDFTEDDFVHRNKEILNADIFDFVDIEEIIEEKDGKPEIVFDPETKKAKPLIKTSIRFKSEIAASGCGRLISEIAANGVKVKIDRKFSQQLFEKIFELDPMKRHKKEHDNALIELERDKHEKSDANDIEDLNPLLELLKRD